MRRDEPSWWYDERARFAPILLAPLSLLYGMVTARRMSRAPAYRSRLPVICIGNFTVGGSGKTPFAAHVCRWFVARGRRPAILTRGYGGSSAGPIWVEEHHDAGAVGDEALLLSRVAPTVVARDRESGAKLIEADSRQFDVIVMDDGFQNRSLAKTLTIVLVNARRGLGNGCVMPAGPLRAPLKVQTPHADVIVIVDGVPATPEKRAQLKAAFASLTGAPVLDAGIEPAGSADLRGKTVVAYCGIAGPERFFDMVAALGAHVVDRAAFRDHHRLSEAEARQLLEKAQSSAALLVTTEKDLARLSGESGARAALRTASIPVAIGVSLQPGDEERLSDLLSRATGLS